MVKIKNANSVVTISELGAEIQSVKINDTEYLWHGDPEFWEGRAPILFPICGGLINGKCIIDNTEFSIPKHGFAMGKVFSVETLEESSVTFLLCDDEETIKIYPYRFELRVTYTLFENKLKTTYNVTNKSGDNMYYSIGSHEAYSCPEGIEQYDIIFPEKETLISLEVVGNQLAHTGPCVLKDGNVLPLYNKYFSYDALVFEKYNSKSVTLKNRTNGREVIVDYPDATMLLVWTKPNAPFVCIEPWCGAPDFVDSIGILSRKQGIIEIKAEETSTTTHTITFK